METNKLSKQISTALNEQMTKEARISHTYLSYGAWASSMGFSGIANFLFLQAQEERNRIFKIIDYILIKGSEVQFTAFPPLPENPVSLSDCFEKVFDREIDKTKAFYKLLKMSFDEEDWTTFNFIQKFVNEQIDEKTFALSLLDKMKLAYKEKVKNFSIYSLNKYLKKSPDDAKSVQEVRSTIPLYQKYKVQNDFQKGRWY
jgi:ferritin